MLNLCIDYMRRHNITRKLGVFHMDYEVQYDETTRYIERVFNANLDILEIYRVCIPFKVPTCTSMYQSYWRPWEESKRDMWVRNMPPGHTWESYMHFLLSTLPARTRDNYLRKLAVSINFWRTRGGVLAEETIEKLKAMGIKIEVGEKSNYKTDKRPVRMEYLDDIDISEFRELPSFKRMCICILKNDHACKYMGFALTKKELDDKRRIMDYYKLFK